MPTFVDTIEEVVDRTAAWGLEQVDTIVDALAPDGRPFGTKELTDEEQLSIYLTLRHNPDAWKVWISDRSLEIVKMLQDAGVPPNEIETVAPLDIAVAFASDYSARMEQLIGDTNGTS